MSETYEHPADVMAWAVNVLREGQRCALAVVTDTEGGAVRAPGALMAVSSSGDAAGYVSGGCIDADVIQQAHLALQSGSPKKVRYGTGSPFVDIQLPCGGAIDVLLIADPDCATLETAVAALERRASTALTFNADGSLNIASPDAPTGWHGEAFTARYRPKLRLRIAGRGADVVALASVAAASGISCVVESPDDDCLSAAERGGITETVKLETPAAISANRDDAATAFALMFHDPHWEERLLRDALAGDAFYIGAVGSRRTQERRRDALAAAGLPQTDIDRIRGPIGLVPSMRDASMLAVSALAEIVEAFHAETTR
ncbi:MAG: XdhC family protein [Pseudomonadota bacterium]